MRFYWLILGALCVWRMTHLLSAEDGPWGVFAWVRRSVAQTFLAGPMNCFYCLSLWIAMPFAVVVGGDVRERVLLWPALSAAAILMERVISSTQPAQAAFWEDGEQTEISNEYESRSEQDVLLRK
ncbi:MAG: hypothetical protein ABI972_16485 [Acidobacteriota bacterium]